MKLRLVALVLFSVALVSGQENNCGWFGTMPVEKRRASGPFAKADKVLLISFFTTGYSVDVIDDEGDLVVAKDSSSVSQIMGVRVLKEFDIARLHSRQHKYPALEIAELNQAETDSLSRWFFNYRPKKTSEVHTIEPGGCYTPRNAVLFLDSNTKVISYLEICFECLASDASADIGILDSMTFPMSCRIEKLNLLKDFLRKKGIRYGVDSNRLVDFAIDTDK